MQIYDATGTGNGVQVTSENQLNAKAEVETEASHHAKLGETFLIATDYVVMPVDTSPYAEYGVLRVVNDSTTKNIYLSYLRTCNDVRGHWKLYKGTTSMSNTTAAISTNMDSGSSTTLDATLQAGTSTSTTVSGTAMATWIQPGPGHSIQPFEGSYILAPQDELMITYTPTADTATTDAVCISLQVWQV